MADGRKNSAASVRQRLKNLSLEKQRDFGLLLVNYGLERLIYRLSVSDYRDKFVLKGGMLVTLWAIDDDRTTRDADFLGFGELDDEKLKATFAYIFPASGSLSSTVSPSTG
ncbi:MAG: nucleotidyl transferase AbiEii/AbiGii toxin family protein [Sphingopyxis sp.]|nr:nucleotidyl transferase AbiEii/AbiGii toxin family protein [Sphingopyxis sp.]